MDRTLDAHRIMSASLEKLRGPRMQRGAINLRKSLLVWRIVRCARQALGAPELEEELQREEHDVMVGGTEDPSSQPRRGASAVCWDREEAEPWSINECFSVEGLSQVPSSAGTPVWTRCHAGALDGIHAGDCGGLNIHGRCWRSDCRCCHAVVEYDTSGGIRRKRDAGRLPQSAVPGKRSKAAPPEAQTKEDSEEESDMDTEDLSSPTDVFRSSFSLSRPVSEDAGSGQTFGELALKSINPWGSAVVAF